MSRHSHSARPCIMLRKPMATLARTCAKSRPDITNGEGCLVPVAHLSHPHFVSQTCHRMQAGPPRRCARSNRLSVLGILQRDMSGCTWRWQLQRACEQCGRRTVLHREAKSCGAEWPGTSAGLNVASRSWCVIAKK
eukprot:1235269-Rhodomonas_salina.1